MIESKESQKYTKPIDKTQYMSATIQCKVVAKLGTMDPKEARTDSLEHAQACWHSNVTKDWR